MGDGLRVEIVPVDQTITDLEDRPWPPGGRLVFKDLDYNEVPVAGNPWPQPCRWCYLINPHVSSDGSTLILKEWVPEAVDLGVSSWAQFEALDIDEQWARWDELEAIGGWRIRTVNLQTGEAQYSATWEDQPIWAVDAPDFDGRYLVLTQSGDHLLIDSHTSEQLPINWGVSEPASGPRTIRLFLPAPAANEIRLRFDGLGVVTFGDPMDDVTAVLVGVLGEPDEEYARDAVFIDFDRGP